MKRWDALSHVRAGLAVVLLCLTSVAVDAQEQNAEGPTTLEELVQSVRDSAAAGEARLAERERRFAEARDERAALLRDARQRRQAAERDADRLRAEFERAEEQLADLELWTHFLAKARKGISLNLIALRKPSYIVCSDACKHQTDQTHER